MIEGSWVSHRQMDSHQAKRVTQIIHLEVVMTKCWVGPTVLSQQGPRGWMEGLWRRAVESA